VLSRSIRINPDGTWSLRDGGTVIGPFTSHEQALAFARDREAAEKLPRPPTKPPDDLAG
jgi:hypothetical protein